MQETKLLLARKKGTFEIRGKTSRLGKKVLLSIQVNILTGERKYFFWKILSLMYCKPNFRLF